MEFGGVGSGWFFETGTLLATAVKLSRCPPKMFGISRAEMVAILLEGGSGRFSTSTRRKISRCSEENACECTVVTRYMYDDELTHSTCDRNVASC